MSDLPLGQKVGFPEKYDKSVLRAIDFHGVTKTGRSGTVFIECPEFTSLCPVTKQPDYGAIQIKYEPRVKLVESKSLKLYLGGFRNHGMFQEEIAVTIMEDLRELLNPVSLSVHVEFASRGGVKITAQFSFDSQGEQPCL